MSLLELIVALVATAIISAVIAPFIRVQIASYVKVRNGKEVVQSSRIGMRRMIAELQQIPVSTQIDRSESTRIQFDTPNQTNIRYTYNSTYKELRRGINAEGDTHVYGVQSFLLRYYDKNNNDIGTSTGIRSNIWKIQIDMTVGDGTDNYQIRTHVSPQAFHYN